MDTKELRSRIADILGRADEPLSAEDIARATDQDLAVAKNQLHVLRRRGRVQTRRPRRWALAEPKR